LDKWLIAVTIITWSVFYCTTVPKPNKKLPDKNYKINIWPENLWSQFRWRGRSKSLLLSRCQPTSMYKSKIQIQKIDEKENFHSKNAEACWQKTFCLVFQVNAKYWNEKNFVTDQNIGHTRAISLKRLYSCHIIPLAGRVKISIF